MLADRCDFLIFVPGTDIPTYRTPAYRGSWVKLPIEHLAASKAETPERVA